MKNSHRETHLLLCSESDRFFSYQYLKELISFKWFIILEFHNF